MEEGQEGECMEEGRSEGVMVKNEGRRKE